MSVRGEAADVVRIVVGVSGRVDMESVLRLRFDNGRVRPWVHQVDGEISFVAGPDAAWLRTATQVDVEDGLVRSRFAVGEGDRVSFVLTHQASHLPPPRAVDAEQALEQTIRFWEDWIGGTEHEGPYGAEVRRSLLLLKALTYAPTGGILAAATTSLPEDPGGSRNWDYRFCWLRDATFTLQALIGCGHLEEARAWRDWLIRAVAGSPEQLQIMYGVDGRRWLPESTADWLGGFADSRPVHIGNAASEQRQLDVWGEVLDSLHLSRESGLQVDETAWDLQVAMLDWLEEHWREPDNGLWEMRGPQRHFVHSKVMAWAGFDRAVRAVESHGLSGPVDRWRAVRDEIHQDVCEHGYDHDRETFTQSYGSRGLDAALLLLPRVGFLPWTDERVLGTIRAVESDLSRDGFVWRYDNAAESSEGSDGLPGEEKAFLACSYWLVDALQATGRHDEAVDLFERLLACRNDVGMLSEEYDPDTGDQWGNTPQAFTLVGLVNSARHLGDGVPTSAEDPRQQAGTA